MKKILFAILCACSLHANAQNECVIPMMVFVPEQAANIPETSQTVLESKLRQVVTQSGLEGGVRFSNFCLVANTSEASKEVMSGKRPLVTLSVDLDLFVGNNYTGERFASSSITLRGSGRNEAQAYSAVFGNIKAGNSQLNNFLKDAKKKINSYYATQIPNIVSQALSFSTRHEYEEALCLLSSVPTCCNDYDKIEDCMLDVFKQYINFDCSKKVAKARAIWNAGQDKEAAELAGAYLAAIDPASSCRDEALKLAEAIRERIGDDWTFYKELKRDEVMLEKTRIEAIRAIGVAYGQNQKATTISEHWMVR